MNIDFTGEYLVNDHGVTFYAIVNEQAVACVISKAALNEMANPNGEDDAETLFLEHQYQFEGIAEGLLLNHRAVDGEIHITRSKL